MKIRTTSDHQGTAWKSVAGRAAEVRRDAFSWSNIANSFRSKTGWNGALNLLQEARTLGFWSVDSFMFIHAVLHYERLANIKKPTTRPLYIQYPSVSHLPVSLFFLFFIFFTITIGISCISYMIIIYIYIYMFVYIFLFLLSLSFRFFVFLLSPGVR